MGGDEKLETLSYKLGACTICGKLIYSNENFVKSEDGYCCNDCLRDQYGVKA
ncbi:MAG: hypothetical protein ABEK10_03190 [Candidatus Nanosalina sp.]